MAVPDPYITSYANALRQDNVKYAHYRTRGLGFKTEDYPGWQHQPVPLLPDMFWLPQIVKQKSNRFPLMRAMLPVQGGARLDSFKTYGDVATSNLSPDVKKAWVRLQTIKEAFETETFKYQKALGYGGNGIAAHYKYEDLNAPQNNRDLVMKAAITGWRSSTLRDEERETFKHKRASHIAQAIEPEAVGKAPRRRLRKIPCHDDSSDEDSNSSGDEDVPPRPPKTPRIAMYAAELARRGANRFLPPDQRRGYQQVPADQLDYLLLEYVENGDLREVIGKVNQSGGRIPNRVLWNFWLSLVKSVVGMAFPPRKFHPDRFNRPDGDLDETIPDVTGQWRIKNMDPNDWVHTDIPGLKLGDFGIAEEIKPQKRDIYYQGRRYKAKPFYFAPEQFCQEWELLPPTPDAENLTNFPAAGTYSVQTNVWGIALSMYSMITGAYPPLPPEPDFIPNWADGYQISYGIRLLDDDWNAFDPELRLMVARCMSHFPMERPSLEELLTFAQYGAAKWQPGETDDVIRKWVADMFYDGQTT
ncbi:Uu.00g065600.m01.CDS01 [Anthostomella pinea]|uniref:Uu.00g065600.m01.CDS01 n=1 Tax=Anthostomella pinea TaxID=933095 RepID=A0AAI8VUL1_9PEZI|nr:Uu.00g065600.m01.CDS01 [Anthostomella pinea]